MKRINYVSLCSGYGAESRGRGPDNAQRYEARPDRLANTVTSVQKDTLLLAIAPPAKASFAADTSMIKKFPILLSRQRTERGKEIRKTYEHDRGVPYALVKAHLPCKLFSTVTSFQTENLIMTTNDNTPDMTYHPEPTKEDLLAHFGHRIRVRKLHPDEAGKLMGLECSDIEKINSCPFQTLAEREEALKTADKSELTRIKKATISKTAKYRMYGNSIVVQVLTAIFRTLYIPNQPENLRASYLQQSLFDDI